MLTAWKTAALTFHKQFGLSTIMHLAIFYRSSLLKAGLRMMPG